ncbi:MAG: oxidoreductase [Ignavibacteria bacterium GWB2_35_12]|nr:MAG: oxidoreductase [Ignavibacteria bacterium GWB2_35_12]OGV23114.1 MAG: oxidoreductase [Ignavibacteria bacterium RIFOXYC2_FULL_35_21]
MFQIFGIGPLTWITFLPLLGMILILLIPSGKDERSKDVSKSLFRWVTIIFTFLQLLLAIWIYANYNYYLAGINDPNGFQFVDKFKWIYLYGLPLLGNVSVDYFVGIDGISAPMVLLTAIVCFVASFSSFSVTKALKGYFAMYLLLDAGMMGVFVALDFFLFYVFWELMLLPMYFLIGIWGGPRKEYAAIKFFLYTLFGSVFMLLVMIALFFAVGSFNMLDMMDPTKYNPNSILFGVDTTWRYIAFMALFVGFAIKIPSVPFHTWLPDAHVEAPTPISVILAGVLLKMGTYGLMRISWPMFPDAVKHFQWFIALVGVVSIVYGALCALGQHRVGKRDFKKLIAYSSVSHMGFVVLGMAALNTTGMEGAILQMFNHGTITSMLFMVVGVLYDRSHTRGLDDFGGMANKMPIYTGLMTISFMAAIGLPGLSGFVSEILVFLGAFQTYPTLTIISATGIVLGAAYMLWTLQKVFFGQVPDRWAGPWDPTHKKYKTDDLNLVELVALAPLALIIIYLGIHPNAMLGIMEKSVNHLIQFVNTGWWTMAAGL